MTNWLHAISKVTSAIDRFVDDIRGYIAEALGIEDPIRVLPYRGYGTPDSLLVKGRVLKDEGIKLREQDAPIYENLWNMYKRFATDEVPDARIRVQLAEFSKELLTNKEGFFNTEIQLDQIIDTDEFWHCLELALVHPSPRKEAIIDKAEVMVVRDDAQFGVISDIDDTIVHTAATDMLKMIQIVYLGNARSRRPFEGVAQFYQALQQGADQTSRNPIFYVSSSAWNMYDVFAQFMDINGIPKGPIALKDVELSLEKIFAFDHETHKRDEIQPILNKFPHLPFLLIGDSGQKDPEIYSRLVREYPGRFLGVLIRDVVPYNIQRQQELADFSEVVTAHGSRFFVFRETAEAVDYAKEQGWIAEPARAIRLRS